MTFLVSLLETKPKSFLKGEFGLFWHMFIRNVVGVIKI